MPLKIKPIKLKQSIYLRVPSNIADLTEMEPDDEVTLKLSEQNNQFLLIYLLSKSKDPQPSRTLQVAQSVEVKPNAT
jgi:hypothetical protein